MKLDLQSLKFTDLYFKLQIAFLNADLCLHRWYGQQIENMNETWFYDFETYPESINAERNYFPIFLGVLK